MATVQGSGIPRVKLESIPDHNVKQEPTDVDVEMSYMDEDEDVYEDAGDLDFSGAQQQIWLSHIPRSLWETCAGLGDDEEIEIGTIRVEGQEIDPQRVSLLLNRIPQFESHHKEYNLFSAPVERLKSRRPGQALVFSEKDLPGYRAKTFSWDIVDEDGNPGQGRSFLYEKHKKEVKRKENKGRFTPYVRRPIPKQTAIAGVITKEFEAVPVKNDEFFVIEGRQTANMLKVPDRATAVFTTSGNDPSRNQMPLMSQAEKTNVNKALLAKRQAQKDNRAARVEKPVLIDKLLELFRLHRIWGLRDLKAKVNQPEQYLRETLMEIAHMHKSGDFNGKWELNEEYKQQDFGLMNPAGMVAPKAEDSDMDKSGLDEDDDDEFEDV